MALRCYKLGVEVPGSPDSRTVHREDGLPDSSFPKRTSADDVLSIVVAGSVLICFGIVYLVHAANNGCGVTSESHLSCEPLSPFLDEGKLLAVNPCMEIEEVSDSDYPRPSRVDSWGSLPTP